MNGQQQIETWEYRSRRFIETLHNRLDEEKEPDNSWKKYIYKSANMHYELGNYLSSVKHADLELVDLYLESGNLLAIELEKLQDYQKVEAIYFHLRYMYDKFYEFKELEVVEYYKRKEREAQENKNKKRATGCFGCLGIIIAIIVLYFIFS